MFTRPQFHRVRPIRRRSGFTLIELLLVLVILAVLAAIVVQNFSGVSPDAKIKAAGTQVSMFNNALSTYEVQNGAFPDDAQGLGALITNPGLDTWKGPYIQGGAIPLDPWQHEYVYHRQGTHNVNGVDVYSTGPDGKEGTEDDIGNWTVRK